jgi:transposase
MEVKKRKRYSKEYKEDVVNMVKTGDKSVKEISGELEIAEAMIYRWYKKIEGETRVTEKGSNREEEIRELRKRLAEAEEERDILKKAVSIFSKQGKQK